MSADAGTLGFRMVCCTLSAESFASAIGERLKVSDNPSRYGDLRVFVEEQELFKRLVAESILPTSTVDVSDNHVPGPVETIADWLEQIAGLHLN